MRNCDNILPLLVFVYNEHGELTEETDARMITTVHTVDELDRVTFVDYPDDTLDITYTYDDPSPPWRIRGQR